MTTYQLKQDMLTNEAQTLLRLDPGSREMWTPTGWVSSSNNEWTGIGGSSEWEEITEDDPGRHRRDERGS